MRLPRLRMSSLQRRLQVGLVVGLTGLMGLLWLVGVVALRDLTGDYIASRLEHDAESLLAALERSPEGDGWHWRRLNPIFQQPLSGHYFVLRFADGDHLSSRSLWDHSLTVPALTVGSEARWTDEGPEQQRLLVWARGYEKEGQRFTLAVAEDITPVEDHRRRFQWHFALLSLGGLLLMLLFQGLLLRRAFQPLDRMRAEVRRLGEGELTALSEAVPDEVRPLVRELNYLLALLAQRLERSRNAVGNLAHALKTPLHLLMRQIDDGRREAPERWEPLQRQVGRMRQLMERELRRARLAGGGAPGQRFDPCQELPDLIATLRAIHREKGLEFDWAIAPGLRPFGDREDLLELAGNLLDNAAKWARRRIRLRFALAEGEVVMSVDDDGPGLTPEQIDGIVGRGVRLDEAVAGHGLGLAIVQDIVRLYEGRLSFADAPELGGLRVEVRLPSA